MRDILRREEATIAVTGDGRMLNCSPDLPSCKVALDLAAHFGKYGKQGAVM
jgi:hypothetical protein